MTDEASDARGRRRPAKTEQAAQIVDALLEAATNALSSQSRVALSMRRIARGAGVSIGSVYYYFRNQNELLVRVVDRENRILAERVLAALDAQPVTSIGADVNTMLGELDRWRTEKSWVSMVPITHLLQRETLTLVLEQSVARFGGLAAAVCRRHAKRAPSTEETTQLVVYLLGVQSLWAMEHAAARDLATTARFVTGFFETLESA